MQDESGKIQDAARQPSPTFEEATRLFNQWLEALDAMMASRSTANGAAAQAATAALIAHLDAHPALDELKPVRERLAIVSERLRQEARGRPAGSATPD